MSDRAVLREEVPAALDGERLDRAVALIADTSRSVAGDLLAASAVRVGGEVTTSGKRRLHAGDVVEIDTSDVPAPPVPQPDPGVCFVIVYEDDDVAVVDKPAGLVVHPGAGHADGTLVNGLLARYGRLADVGDPARPGIVHRLDAGTSGLLVVARTEAAAESLQAQFVDRRAGRRYDALVWGHPDAPHGVIDAPIGRNRRDPVRMALVADGRAARTEYEVVGEFLVARPPGHAAPVARVSCRLETGRTHQIRVHLAGIGHPVVGDDVYGGGRGVDAHGAAQVAIERPFLHAAELGFDHPTTGDRMTFTSALPRDLDAQLRRLEAATA